MPLIPSRPWTPNESEEQPCRLIIYDTETVWEARGGSRPMQKHTWRLACGRYYTRKGSIWSSSDIVNLCHPSYLWTWIYECCRCREPLWVYAHNAAFDFAVAGGWREIDEGHMRLAEPGRWYRDRKTGMPRQGKDFAGRLAVDNLPFIVETATDYGKIKFVDTMNYLPVSLEKIASWVGLEKVPLPANDAPDSEWYERCRRDVEITGEAVMKLMGTWRDDKLGNWQSTLAGLAYSSYRHVNPDSGIVAHGDDRATPEQCYEYWRTGTPMPPDAHDVSRLERDAYYGGRVYTGFLGDVVPHGCLPGNGELFGEHGKRALVDGPVTIYDVNGLYAHVMRECEYPLELYESGWELDVADLQSYADHFGVIARVRVSSPDRCYPVRDNGRVVYARGDYVTSLAGPELQIALAAGHVNQCHAFAVYYTGTPFRKYVDYWWAKRLAAIADGDEVTSRLCKVMVNALFGKLGQRYPLWERDDGIQAPCRWGPFLHDAGDERGLMKCRAVAGVAQYKGERRDCRHTFTAAAAFVTSHARVFMDAVRDSLPKKSVLYQDTDSLFLLPAGADVLESMGRVDATELGKFKNQGTYQFLSIFGAKNYAKDGCHVAAGLRSNAEYAGEQRWRQWHFERCQSTIAREPDGSIWAWQEIFTSPQHVAGAIPTASGWTEPVTLRR